jgi:signal transduction histidine kinase
MDLNKKIIDLDYLIDSTIPLVETSASTKNIKIKKNQFNKSKVLADEQLLKQVILNILSNAIKFTAENKMITISYKSEDNLDIISICDEGIGLTREQIEKIFEPFSQVYEHHNKAIKGTGLGLAISQKIIQLHNGYIEVESEVGVGSCFNIHIPKAQETE